MKENEKMICGNEKTICGNCESGNIVSWSVIETPSVQIDGDWEHQYHKKYEHAYFECTDCGCEFGQTG